VRKVGHSGTLDPFATGVLPLTLGRATRLTSYFLASDKTYRGVMRFGFATATFDLDGEPLGEDARPELDRARLEEVFSAYRGRVSQTLPPYSAKKVRGKPMYAYARAGVELEAATKEVTIHELRLLAIDGCEAEFELACSAGTYARSLAHDIGRDYGCGAHLARLRRTRSGEFPVEIAVPLTDGTDFPPREFFLERLIPMRELLREIPAVTLSDGDRARVLQGLDLNLLTRAADAEEYRLLDERGELIGLARRIQTFASPVPQPVQWVRIHPRVVFA